jgi:hypothetical protein
MSADSGFPLGLLRPMLFLDFLHPHRSKMSTLHLVAMAAALDARDSTEQNPSLKRLFKTGVRILGSWALVRDRQQRAIPS